MWVKICGVTTVDDAVMIASAGADAVGLNFYAQSKRFVRPADECSGEKRGRDSFVQSTHQAVPANESRPLFSADTDGVITHAKAIRDAVADDLDVVGVFVNSSADEVADIASRTQLTAVQFHGDESPQLTAEFHRQCPDIGIIRAFRIGDDGTSAMDAHLTELASLHVPVAAVLVDAYVPGAYGGTGHTVNSETVNAWSASAGKEQRLILAGGLTPENVSAAAESVSPWGIDTASGVESSPGIKNPDKVREFVAQIRNAGRPAGRWRV